MMKRIMTLFLFAALLAASSGCSFSPQGEEGVSAVSPQPSAGIVSAQNDTEGQPVDETPALEELKQLYEAARNKTNALS